MTSKLDENLFGTYRDLNECSTSKFQNNAKMTHPNTGEPLYTVYWRMQARGKRKYIVRFHKCILCIDIGLSPAA